MLIDASAAASWLLPGQRTLASEALLEDSDAHVFAAPHLFPAEIRNVLLALERRGRLTGEQSRRAMAALASYGVDIRPPPAQNEYDEILGLARRERLTVYDAVYLREAARGDFTLVSRDADLLAAAARNGVPIEDLRGG